MNFHKNIRNKWGRFKNPEGTNRPEFLLDGTVKFSATAPKIFIFAGRV
jgi:hypothetical protein